MQLSFIVVHCSQWVWVFTKRQRRVVLLLYNHRTLKILQKSVSDQFCSYQSTYISTFHISAALFHLLLIYKIFFLSSHFGFGVIPQFCIHGAVNEFLFISLSNTTVCPFTLHFTVKRPDAIHKCAGSAWSAADSNYWILFPATPFKNGPFVLCITQFIISVNSASKGLCFKMGCLFLRNQWHQSVDCNC